MLRRVGRRFVAPADNIPRRGVQPEACRQARHPPQFGAARTRADPGGCTGRPPL